MGNASGGPGKIPQTIREVNLPERIRAASGANLKEAGDFFGWEPARVTESAADFTKDQLLARGWTKDRLLDVAEGYEHILPLTTRVPQGGPHSYASLPNYLIEEKDMAHSNHFLIRNDSPTPLTLNIEPEGAFVLLQKGEEVSVFEEFKKAPVSLRWTVADQGGSIVSLWPGDGEIRVEKDGIDVFELPQQRARI